MPLEVWIPKSTVDKTYRCNVCLRRFPEDQKQQWARHVGACGKKNLDNLQELVARRESNDFQSVSDKEKFAWIRNRARQRKEL